jgi:signal recognition particle receptor subunit beta
MVSSDFDWFPTYKILIAGGFGVGKTTFVGAISEIKPLTTEEQLTIASVGTDSLAGVGDKTTTTVAMDYGRITFHRPTVQLHLFGTPGQDRFWFMWDDLVRGALGAVVLADTRRLRDCFAAVEFFEHRKVDFLVAVNEFPDQPYHYEPDEVRAALDIKPHVPVVRCDARDTRSVAEVLIALIKHKLVASPPRPA